MSLFGKVTVIGIGLIGSSLARVIKRDGLARRISCYDVKPQYMQKALELGIVDEIHKNIADSVKNADLIVLSAPVGAYGKIIREIAPFLKNDAVITDVGSIKKYVIREIEANLPPDSKVSVVPGHPVAGTEKSGPEAGFDTLFEGRWFIMTPYERSSDAAVEKISKLWAHAKMRVDSMTPEHHDKVMAAVSHLPHLIAFSIVGTVADLEGYEQKEIIKYSASGFRDFTRIAGSDPTMWRDILLNNKTTILELIQRFVEDLIALERNIRWDEGDKLFELFPAPAKSAGKSLKPSRISRKPKRKFFLKSTAEIKLVK
ncbi:MAG: prephenate dehydrogenase/arogenate dehydrogenase family protein [Alphaproteobacteria bacterium]